MNCARAFAVLWVLAIGSSAHCREIAGTPPEPVETPLSDLSGEPVIPGKNAFVEAFVWLNSDGSVSRAVVHDSSDPQFAGPAARSLRRWTFRVDPTGKNRGENVCAIRIEYRDGWIIAGPARWPEKPDVEPRFTKAVEPEYPFELENSGNKGKVMVSLVLSAKGEVIDPTIVSSPHPGFEAAAISAIMQSEFSPAMKDGKPVAVVAVVPVRFLFRGHAGVDPYRMETGRKSEGPQLFKVDVLPKPKTTVAAVYPYEFAINGKKGSARVKVVVGPTGVPLLTSIVEASEPEFGMALAASLEAWIFDPALLNKKPAMALLEREFKFAAHSRDSSLDLNSWLIAQTISNGRFAPVKAGDLDAPLKASFRVAPVYPTVLLDKRLVGSAKIELIVDKKGHAVLPRIVEASEPEFGWAAATAAQRWLFTPPTVDGKPAEVKVVIPFGFNPPEPPAEGGPGDAAK